MPTYQEQLRCAPADIDIEFWQEPEGIAIPDDELKFLLIPDAVEALAVFEVAQQVHRYQQAAATDSAAIEKALMITMGGLLPGILLRDHLYANHLPDTPLIEFGTVGASLYTGPDTRHDKLTITQEPSLSVKNATVLLVDDLCDRGDTMQFLAGHIARHGAKEVLSLALYTKPEANLRCHTDFSFGTVDQDTWIITPRETVETLSVRVPVWKERGASVEECRRRLIDLIGYPRVIADYYLKPIYDAAK